MVVGSRHLFFLHRPGKVPELKNVEVYPMTGPPRRYLLAADGNAIPEGKGVDEYLRGIYPEIPENELIARIEKAIADTVSEGTLTEYSRSTHEGTRG